MKILVSLFIFILCAFECLADGKVQGWPAAASGGCTGDETLVAHFENSDTINSGTPAGCSVGASSWTNTGVDYVTTPGVQGGTYSAKFDATSDQLTVAVTSEDILTDEAGTIDLYFTFSTFASGRTLTGVAGGSDFIRVRTYGTDELEMRWRGGNNTQTIDLQTTDCDLATDGTQYHLIAKWDRDGGTNTLSLDCGGTVITSSTALLNWTTAPSAYYLGKDAVSGVNGTVDTLHIYKAWQ